MYTKKELSFLDQRKDLIDSGKEGWEEFTEELVDAADEGEISYGSYLKLRFLTQYTIFGKESFEVVAKNMEYSLDVYLQSISSLVGEEAEGDAYFCEKFIDINSPKLKQIKESMDGDQVELKKWLVEDIYRFITEPGYGKNDTDQSVPGYLKNFPAIGREVLDDILANDRFKIIR